MKKNITLFLTTFCFINVLLAQTKKSLPVIDMHLHALHADQQGPPPATIATPYRDFGSHDPKNSWAETFTRVTKFKEWSDSIVSSPKTDDSLQNLTIASLNRRNVYGVTSGDVDIVRKWKAAAPKRIINAVQWNFSEIKRHGLTLCELCGSLLTKYYCSLKSMLILEYVS